MSDQSVSATGAVTPPFGTRSPEDALSALMAGNQRFVGGQPAYGHDIAAAQAYASGDQQPYAAVLGCIDSRVPLEAIFDQTFGCICVLRSGGHVVDRAILGSLEFAVGALGVPLIMVLGHERCGAVASTVQAVHAGERPSGEITYLVDQIAPAVTDVGAEHEDATALAIRRHVERTVQAVRTTPTLAPAVDSGRLGVVGAVYDLATGRVDLLG